MVVRGWVDLVVVYKKSNVFFSDFGVISSFPHVCYAHVSIFSSQVRCFKAMKTLETCSIVLFSDDV